MCSLVKQTQGTLSHSTCCNILSPLVYVRFVILVLRGLKIAIASTCSSCSASIFYLRIINRDVIHTNLQKYIGLLKVIKVFVGYGIPTSWTDFFVQESRNQEGGGGVQLVGLEWLYVCVYDWCLGSKSVFGNFWEIWWGVLELRGWSWSAASWIWMVICMCVIDV